MSKTKEQCPVCSGESLSSEAGYAAFENTLRFPRIGKKGFLGPKDLNLGPSKARVCLDCGYVMLFLAPADIERLKNPPSSKGN